MTSPRRVLTWSAVSSKKQAKDDKFSIPDQIAMGRQIAADLDGDLVDELVVRGFSRDYRTLAEVVAATQDKEMDAFRRLHDHIQARDFDVFVCVDADRFGRKASLVLEIIDLITEELGADMITYIDNMTMNDENSLTIGLLKAYKAQMDIKRMKENHRKGMNNRAAQHKLLGSFTPLFLLRLRDESGKEVATVVNEELRPLWTDIAAVVLDRIRWDECEQALFDRYGHGVDGQPFKRGSVYGWLMNPAFWGHNARNWRKRANTWVKQLGPWIWDDSVDAPDSVLLFRHVRPAVYSGEWAELGERVKAELWRRYRLKGKAKTRNTFRFHGLLVCDGCGYSLNQSRSGMNDHVYMACQTRHRKAARGIDCPERRYIHADKVKAYFDAQLRVALDSQATELFEVNQEVALLQRSVEDEQRQIERQRDRIQALVMELADAPAVAREVYRQQIARLSQEIDAMQGRLFERQREVNSRRNSQADQARVIGLLKERGVDWLWEQEDGFIHQVLSTALGDNQLVVKDGEIIGAIPAPNRRIITKRRNRRPSV
jgi:DNA invertase Pin-like site-specific DNA recombinase